MERRPLLWLLSLPLAASGTLAGHWLGYLLIAPHAEHRAQVLHETGHGYLRHVPLFLALCLALVLVALALRIQRRLPGDPSAWTFALVPPLAFLVQEVAERLIATGSVDGAALAEAPVLVGLLVQLPLALAAYLLARALLACADAIATAASAMRPRLFRRIASTRAPLPTPLTPVAVLAEGHAGRAPPAAHPS